MPGGAIFGGLGSLNNLIKKHQEVNEKKFIFSEKDSIQREESQLIEINESQSKDQRNSQM